MDSKPPNEDMKVIENAKQDAYDPFFNLKIEQNDRPEDFKAPDLITPADVSKEIKEDRELEQTKNQYRFSTLSKGAYDVYYKSPDWAENEVKKVLPRHNIIGALSDKNSSVWVREHPVGHQGQQEVVIAYRGTGFKGFGLDDLKSSAEDLAADAGILAGINITGRMKEADEKYKDTASYYPDAKIITTGHSLGGTQALYVARKHGLEGHIFNTGSSPLGLPDEIGGLLKGNSKITSYSVMGDLISLSNRYLDKADNRVIVPNKTWAVGVLSHDLTNFLPNKVIKKSNSEWLFKDEPAIPKNTIKSLASFTPIKDYNYILEKDKNRIIKPKNKKPLKPQFCPADEYWCSQKKKY